MVKPKAGQRVNRATATFPEREFREWFGCLHPRPVVGSLPFRQMLKTARWGWEQRGISRSVEPSFQAGYAIGKREAFKETLEFYGRFRRKPISIHFGKHLVGQPVKFKVRTVDEPDDFEEWLRREAGEVSGK